VWGAATLGFSDEGMLKAVAGEAVVRLSDFNPQELSNILVAYARVGYVHIPLLEVQPDPNFTVLTVSMH